MNTSKPIGKASGRPVWRSRASPKREQSRIAQCPHCRRHYDVATEFDAHYQGACVGRLA